MNTNLDSYEGFRYELESFHFREVHKWMLFLSTDTRSFILIITLVKVTFFIDYLSPHRSFCLVLSPLLSPPLLLFFSFTSFLFTFDCFNFFSPFLVLNFECVLIWKHRFHLYQHPRMFIVFSFRFSYNWFYCIILNIVSSSFLF